MTFDLDISHTGLAWHYLSRS